MNLNDELKGIYEQTSGVLCLMIMGYDGILVSEFKKPGLDLTLEQGVLESINILRDFMKVFLSNDLGKVKDLSIKTNKYCFVFKGLTEEYFFCAAADVDSVIGKLNFYVDKKTLEFSRALL